LLVASASADKTI
jgi:U3 small nucleolar RNA-associated protein 12